MVLIGFLYKTAQKPLENRSNLAWKIVQKPPQEMSGFWAVFERFFKQDLSSLSGFSKKKRSNRSNRSYIERFLGGISTRDLAKWNWFSEPDEIPLVTLTSEARSNGHHSGFIIFSSTNLDTDFTPARDSISATKWCPPHRWDHGQMEYIPMSWEHPQNLIN